MILTPEVLKVVAPKADAGVWCPAITKACAEWRIDTPLRLAAFLAQTSHESVDFTHLSENLNYSADGLVKTWPKRFTPTTAKTYARQPERIANYVYASRYGNGDEKSGDGYRFRGRGLIQLTFRANYRAAGKALGCDLEVEPERIIEPSMATRSAAWYWSSHGLNGLADTGDLISITKAINGGLIGYEERAARYAKAREALRT